MLAYGCCIVEPASVQARVYGAPSFEYENRHVTLAIGKPHRLGKTEESFHTRYRKRVIVYDIESHFQRMTE